MKKIIIIAMLACLVGCGKTEATSLVPETALADKTTEEAKEVTPTEAPTPTTLYDKTYKCPNSDDKIHVFIQTTDDIDKPVIFVEYEQEVSYLESDNEQCAAAFFGLGSYIISTIDKDKYYYQVSLNSEKYYGFRFASYGNTYFNRDFSTPEEKQRPDWVSEFYANDSSMLTAIGLTNQACGWLMVTVKDEICNDLTAYMEK